jgi:hypothetical protein
MVERFQKTGPPLDLSLNQSIINIRIPELTYLYRSLVYVRKEPNGETGAIFLFKL